MKNLLVLSVMLFTFLFINAQNKMPIGIWKGIYYCSKGETGLTLEFKKYGNNSKTEFFGTFEFYPNTSSSNAHYGKYSVKGQIIGGKIVITPNKWIIRPKNYGMVGMTGVLSENYLRFKGFIKSPNNSCGEFDVFKQSARGMQINLSSSRSQTSSNTTSTSQSSRWHPCEFCNMVIDKPYYKRDCEITWRKESKPGYQLCSGCHGNGVILTNVNCNCGFQCFESDCYVRGCIQGWYECSHCNGKGEVFW